MRRRDGVLVLVGAALLALGWWLYRARTIPCAALLAGAHTAADSVTVYRAQPTCRPRRAPGGPRP